jgi:hypothetical protein
MLQPTGEVDAVLKRMASEAVVQRENLRGILIGMSEGLRSGGAKPNTTKTTKTTKAAPAAKTTKAKKPKARKAARA